MAGFVYIMSNEAFRDGLLKIGMSSSDPMEFRRDELYTTGVPHPFKVEYFAFVDNHERVEKIVHRRLKDKRPNYQREFFSCTVPEAIILIRESASIHYEKILYKSPEEIENERKRQAFEERKKRDDEKKRVDNENKEREEQEKKKTLEQEINKEKMKNSFIDSIKVFVALIIVLIAFPLAIVLGNFGWILVFLVGAIMYIFLFSDPS